MTLDLDRYTDSIALRALADAAERRASDAEETAAADAERAATAERIGHEDAEGMALTARLSAERAASLRAEASRLWRLV